MNDKDIDKVEVSQKEEKESKFRYLLYLFLLSILLFFGVFGITYSIYKGDSPNDNEIITDQIVFTYSDVDKAGNGIFIQNATPIPDAKGKLMTGKNEYFDFYITASTKKSKIFYQLLLYKGSDSTLSNNNVRIYLTEINGRYEKELVLTDFSNLKRKELNNKDYYVLYDRVLNQNIESYNHSYRLRMWVKEEAKNYEDKFFSVKVDVHAEQIEG